MEKRRAMSDGEWRKSEGCNVPFSTTANELPILSASQRITRPGGVQQHTLSAPRLASSEGKASKPQQDFAHNRVSTNFGGRITDMESVET
jgi:hypothetical protein